MKFKFVVALLLVASVILGGLACRHLSSAESRKPIYYTCPMHPSVKVAQPGNCPLCGMKLVPVYSETATGPVAPCGAACCASPGATNQP